MSAATKPKIVRFLWRLARNLLCAIPFTRRLMFPPEQLSASFGRGDPEYAWSVFVSHRDRITRCGYSGATSILEVGPGQNVGTALLWWAFETSRHRDGPKVRVVLWDVFANAPWSTEIWAPLAAALLERWPNTADMPAGALAALADIAYRREIPDITYVVGPINCLVRDYESTPFDLVYSHAALEHVWDIASTWQTLRYITASHGWHSHRIDLADHGSRETNYIEMLEWSSLSYWLTMRFVPGAINRWRGYQHVNYLRDIGLNALAIDAEDRPCLPIPRNSLALPFRQMAETDLRMTAIDIVARRNA